MATIVKPRIKLLYKLPMYKADAIPIKIKVRISVMKIVIQRINELAKIAAVLIDLSFIISNCVLLSLSKLSNNSSKGFFMLSIL